MKRGICIISIFVAILLPFSSTKGQMSGATWDIISDDFSSNFFGRQEGSTFLLYTHVADIDTSTTTAVSGIGQRNTIEGGIFYSDELSYEISRETVHFGDLSVNEVKVQNVTTTITTDSITGYTLSMHENHQMQTADGNHDVADVSDGEVSAGSEEYGIRTSGPDIITSTDIPITASSTDIVGSLGRVTKNDAIISFRAAIDRIHARAGTYSHTATLTLTVNP